MAATTNDRDTPTDYIQRQIAFPLKAGVVIPAGVIVCTDATGAAVNGSDTAGLIVQGRAAHAADATAGDTEIVVERGVFEYANDGTITQANVGQLATVLDNQTVSTAATTVNDIGAGYIEQIRPTGVVISMLGGKVAAA